MTKRILLVGCGRMGAALARGWLATDDPPEIVAIEPAPVTLPDGISHHQSAETITNERFDAVVLAVKPQMLPGVLPTIARFTGPAVAVLSIAAGFTLARLAAALPPGTPILRAMPNTPAAIGAGVSVICANAEAGADPRALATHLLAAVGTVHWLDDEGLMDAVTALSGSGPAYVFALGEAMAKAGAILGLDPALAAALARATLEGSGALLTADPASLTAHRHAVTSPGGTTAAALAVLQGDAALDRLVDTAMQAARDRGRALSGG